MNTDGTIFFGAVLKAIACTPNRNTDEASYERDVLEPCRAIRAIAERVGDGVPSEEQVHQTLSLLSRVLEAKRVDPTEREERIREVLSRTRLPESFRPKAAA